MSRSLRLAAAALILAAVPLGAATPRVSYEVARDREQAVRTRLDTTSPAKAAIDEARRVVQAYMRLAARYPRSGYTDNALAQAAALSADVWGVTGEDRDRALAVRLYKRLVSGYPTSSLVPVARKELKRLETDDPAAPSQASSPAPITPAPALAPAAAKAPKPDCHVGHPGSGRSGC